MTPIRSFAVLAVVAVLAAACGDASEVDPDPAAPATTAAAPTNAIATTTFPTTTVPDEDPGGQPATGWRLLADEPAGRPYEVSVALSAETLARMWEYHGFTTPLPTVDHEHEVVVLLGQAVSGSCPGIRLDDLVVRGDRVFGEFTFLLPAGATACTGDANPHSFVLAVDKAALPAAFTLQLAEELICGGCDKESLAVDLSDPELDEALWGFGRILIVRDGPGVVAPDASLGFATPSYGQIRNWAVEVPFDGPFLAHVIEPATGTYILDAGNVDCSAGDCGDNPPPLESPCRAFVDAVPGADVWAVYTVAPDGTCTWSTHDTYDLPDRPDEG